MNIQKMLKNSTISTISQVIVILLQFVNRRIFIIFLDIEYLGYQTLFSKFFSLLSVAELGIGNIISFHLYREVVDKNEREIGKLMYIYKWLYRVIAGIVLLAGIICCFLLPYFIKDASFNWKYLYKIYFLQLTSVILGYFLSYRRTIYIVTQQEYKCVQIDLYISIIVQILQIFLLSIFHNYLLYLIVQLSQTLISNIIITWKTNKDYPYLKNRYSISREYLKEKNIFSDMKNYLVHQMSYSIYGSSDNIIISAICGIRNVAIFGNYVDLQNGVMKILFYRLLNPVQATIGNIIYSDRSKESQWNLFESLDVFSFFFASYISVGFYVFFQPVIQLWMGEEYLLSDLFVMIFTISIYFGAVWEIVYKYRTVFGDYRQDRNLMILSAVVNILVSIPGAYLLGITGVQFGTLVAFFPIAYGRIRFVVKNYFKKPLMRYIGKHLVLAVVSAIECVLCGFITKNMSVNILGLLKRGIVWAIVPLVINLAIYFKNPYFKEMVEYLKGMVEILRSKLCRKDD